MTQLMTAIESIRTGLGGGRYPPDGTNQHGSPAILQGRLPRDTWGNGRRLPRNQPGYRPVSSGWAGPRIRPRAFIGFSANPQNPFDTSPSRIPGVFDVRKSGQASAANAARPARTVLLTAELPPAAAESPRLTSGRRLEPLSVLRQNGVCLSESADGSYFKAVKGMTRHYSQQLFNPSVNPTQNTCPMLIRPDFRHRHGLVKPSSFQLCVRTGRQVRPVYFQYVSALPVRLQLRHVANGLDDMTNFTKGQTVGDDIP